MSLTWRHLWQARKRRMSTDIRSGDFFDLQSGMVTIQYPQETIPIPDNGRYRLHNEMDDCIVCDKCVKVCPVDCIEIEPIRAIEEVGRASDGSPIRLYAAKFDIDMAKCCYCGLCTTVCPTECLTMTKTFDYSELDVRDMVYSYANLSPEEADEKRRLLEQFQKEKEALKAAPKPVVTAEATPVAPVARPAFKPTIKPKQQEVEAKEETSAAPAKPTFIPRKPAPVVEKAEPEETQPTEIQKETVPKLPFRPSMKPKVEKALETSSEIIPADPENPVNLKNPDLEIPAEPVTAKPAFRPMMKPKTAEPVDPENSTSETPVQPASAKPAFRPTMKPKTIAPINPELPVSEVSDKIIPVNPENSVSETAAEPILAKPAFRPTMKPKAPAPANPELPVPEVSDKIVSVNPENTANLKNPVLTIEEKAEELPKPKPAFRPTMKPKPKQD